MGLGRDGVLVGEDCGAAAGETVGGGRVRMRGAGVDGGDYGEVVLVFVEVCEGGGEGAVERVVEGRIEGAEGEFVDGVGEVEGCWARRLACLSLNEGGA